MEEAWLSAGTVEEGRAGGGEGRAGGPGLTEAGGRRDKALDFIQSAVETKQGRARLIGFLERSLSCSGGRRAGGSPGRLVQWSGAR